MILVLYLALFLQVQISADIATVEGIAPKQGTTDPLAQVIVGHVPEGQGRAVGPRFTTDDTGKFRHQFYFRGLNENLYLAVTHSF